MYCTTDIEIELSFSIDDIITNEIETRYNIDASELGELLMDVIAADTPYRIDESNFYSGLILTIKVGFEDYKQVQEAITTVIEQFITSYMEDK